MMLSAVLSALLLGLYPVSADISPAMTVIPLEEMRIAPPADAIVIDKRLSASGILIMDLRTGQTIYSAQGDVERPMASLTKLMTALIIVEHHRLNEWVTVPKKIADTQGSVAYLPPGERFTVGDLLTALLVASANDAAVTLAQYHSDSEESFVKEMNARAVALGLVGTQYANASGLDNPRQWSTPRDIAHLVAFIQKYSAIKDRMGMRSATIRSRGGRTLVLTNTNALLRAQPGLVREGKTGTTNAAGQCLATIVEKNGRSYVVVLFHSLQRYKDMKVILGTIFGPEGENMPPVEDTECEQGGGCPIP